MNEVGYYAKKPIVVEAIQWRCDVPVLEEWGCQFRPSHDDDCAIHESFVNPCNCELSDYEEGQWWWHGDRPVEVWNGPDQTWKTIPVGHWIIKGPAEDDFYPCAPDVFEDTYLTPYCDECGNRGCPSTTGGTCWIPVCEFCFERIAEHDVQMLASCMAEIQLRNLKTEAEFQADTAMPDA